MDPNTLSHVGVLGMKWGHRKSRTRVSALPAHGTNRAPHQETGPELSEARKKEIQLRQTPVKALTTAELKSVNERIQAERTYKSLLAASQSPVKKIAIELLTTGFKQASQPYITKYMGKGFSYVEKMLIKE